MTQIHLTAQVQHSPREPAFGGPLMAAGRRDPHVIDVLQTVLIGTPVLLF